MDDRCQLRFIFIIFVVRYSTVAAGKYSDLYETYYMTDFCNDTGRAILVEDNGRPSVGMLKLTDVPYEVGFNCTTIIKSPQNYSILIDIVEMSIRTNNCSFDCLDRLQIVSGNETYHWPISSPVCGVWKKEVDSKLIYFAFGYIMVKFTSSPKGINKYYTGFSLIFTAYNKSKKGICHGKDRFRCNNDACIWMALVCDGYNNCRDRSDEAFCGRKGGNSSLGIGGYIGLSFAILMAVAIIVFLLIPPLKQRASHMTNISTISTSSRWTFASSRTCLTDDDSLPSYEQATRSNPL